MIKLLFTVWNILALPSTTLRRLQASGLYKNKIAITITSILKVYNVNVFNYFEASKIK